MAASRNEGHEKGVAEGHEKGVAEGRAEGEQALRLAVEGLCDVLGIEIDRTRREQLTAMPLEELRQLHGILRTERRWPDR